MAKITALHENKGRDRVSIFLDGRLALTLSAGLVTKEGLRRDQELTDQQIDSLSHLDSYEHCLKAASRLLLYRPRSTSELRNRLARRGFETAMIDSVLAHLNATGLLDDAAFARFWTDNRQSFSPRSRRLARVELQRKGVAGDLIEQAITAIDDEACAYRAAYARATRMNWSDWDQFRRRLGGYLHRRGFAYGVVDATLRRIWEEFGGANPADE